MNLEKPVRVIIDTDCGCEADDQYALAHALIGPKLEVAGIISVRRGREGCAFIFDDLFAKPKYYYL